MNLLQSPGTSANPEPAGLPLDRRWRVREGCIGPRAGPEPKAPGQHAELHRRRDRRSVHGKSASAKWDLTDVIKSDITFKGLAENREHVRQNDVPVSGGTRDLRSPATDWRRGIRSNWGGSFNGRIRPMFDPKFPITFRFERRLTARGHTTDRGQF